LRKQAALEEPCLELGKQPYCDIHLARFQLVSQVDGGIAHGAECDAWRFLVQPFLDSYCLNCHGEIFANSPFLQPVRTSFETNRPLEWTRVHDLPDFVHFDHSIHVSKGMGCTTCHGPVDRMALTWQEQSLQMEWCLECHRNPERYVRPRTQVFSVAYRPPANQIEVGRQLVAEYNIQKLQSCSTCHQ
jgi:hypothetical protein